MKLCHWHRLALNSFGRRGIFRSIENSFGSCCGNFNPLINSRLNSVLNCRLLGTCKTAADRRVNKPSSWLLQIGWGNLVNQFYCCLAQVIRNDLARQYVFLRSLVAASGAHFARQVSWGFVATYQPSKFVNKSTGVVLRRRSWDAMCAMSFLWVWESHCTTQKLFSRQLIGLRQMLDLAYRLDE